jgi:hypothetical protein
MIKTFDEFSLCEGVGSKMKRIDFEGAYAKVIDNLTAYIIEYIKTYGDIVFEEPEDLYFINNRKVMISKNIVSIRVDEKSSKFGSGQNIVATAEDGTEIPIGFTTTPSNTYFRINDYIYNHIN